MAVTVCTDTVLGARRAGIWGSALCEVQKILLFFTSSLFTGYGLATQLHLVPKLETLGATSPLCFFMKCCLIKFMDFVYCRLNFLFLFVDSLWPPFISTTTAYSSLYLVFNLIFYFSLYCLLFLLFIFTTLVLFLFFPLKTQILRMLPP